MKPQPTTRITPTFTLLPGADQILTATPTGDSALRAYHLRLMALRLNLVAGFDDLLSLDSIDFTPFDYQIKAARTALRRFREWGMLNIEDEIVERRDRLVRCLGRADGAENAGAGVVYDSVAGGLGIGTGEAQCFTT